MSRINDPRWTAFILGELEAAERDSTQQELERDPAAIELVEQIRDICSLMQESLQDFSAIELTAGQRESILAAGTVASQRRIEKRGRIRWLLIAASAAVVLLTVGLAAIFQMGRAGIPPAPAGNIVAKRALPGTPALSQNAQVSSPPTGPAGSVTPATRPIVALDRTGRIVDTLAPAQTYYGFRPSPDGRLLAIDRLSDSGTREIWLLDLVTKTMRRLTFGGGASPVWSPDGRAIVFNDPASNRLFRTLSDGSGPKLALADGAQAVFDWSPDGRGIAFQGSSGPRMISPSGGMPYPIVQPPLNEEDVRFSPDGRLMAFVSAETGRPEIYVRSLPDDGARYRVTARGGSYPRWHPSGRELFYLTPGGELMSTEIVQTQPENSLRWGAPRLLFQVPAGNTPFEITRDGRWFILLGASQ